MKEHEERTREEQKEHRDLAREDAQIAAAAAASRVHPRGGLGFSGGGGPTFLLNVTEGLEAEKEDKTAGEGKYHRFSIAHEALSIMGQKTVAPGSIWEVFSIYLVTEMSFRMQSNPAETFTGLNVELSLNATLYRNSSPIWIASGNVTPNASSSEGVLHWAEGATPVTVGTEFSNPIILGAGESLMLETSLEYQAAWGNTASGLTFVKLVGKNGKGVVRYSVREAS